MGRSKAIVLHQEQQHEYHHQQHQQHQQQHPQHQQQQRQRQQPRSRDVMSQRPANIRIRRAILAGKRGPTTPVPSWKLYENPSYDGIMAGTEAAGRQITISARKLAATLWELQELPLCPRPAAATTTTTAAARRPSRSRSRSGSRPSQSSSRQQQQQQRESVGSPKHLMLPPPSPTTPVPHNATTNQRRSPYSDSATYRASEDTYASETPRQSFEVESQKQAQQQQQQDTIDDDRDCARNSTDLLKLLSQIRGMDQAPPGSAPLAAVLRLELEHTRQRVRELEQANRAARRDIESLLERTETERSAWRAREQERWRSAVVAAKQEAEEEKRQKRRSEHRARKLAAQLAEVNSALARAVAEAERERKARQLMEEVCDELAREIGQDKAEVEELKRESEKVREEVEEERRMLQMAEVWREERVQMKLAEARHELEEKNSVLDRLRGELEDFLRSKPGSTAAPPPPQSPIESSELQKASNLRAAMDSLRKPKVGAAAAAAADDDDDPAGSSAEEDLHSIDLNKESLYDRTQGNRWTSGKKQEQADEQAEKRPEPRRKGFRGRRRLRRPRTHDESSLGPNRSCSDGFGPSSRKIETIPEEQQQELYMENGGGGGGGGGGRRGFRQGNPEPWSDYEDDDTIKIDARDDDDFALEYTQHRRSQDGSTPTLSPLLHSASFPLSSVPTPQRNSWSSGDLNQSGMRGFGDWQRSSSRDNSLRAKLLEAKIMEEPVHHHHHHRGSKHLVS